MRFTRRNYLKGKIPNLIMQEIKYLHFSRLIWFLLLALVILFGVVLFMNYQAVISADDEYKWALSTVNEEDIEGKLSQDFEVTEDGKGGQLIKNPLPYYKAQVEQYAYAANPAYTVTQVLEVSFWLILPLLFGIMGLVMASNDYTQSTLKLKAPRLYRWQYAISKHVVLLISTVAVFIFALLIAWGMGAVMFRMLENAVDLSGYNTALEQKGMLLKFLFAYGTGFLFAEIGFTLGLIFKRTSIGIVALFGYIYFVPTLGKFDPTNAANVIATKVYDFYGVTQVTPAHATSAWLSAAVLLTLGLVFIAGGILLVKRRSLYM